MVNHPVDELVDLLIHGVHPRMAVVRLHVVVRVLSELAGDEGTRFLEQASAEMAMLKNSQDGPAVLARIARQMEV